MNKKNIAWLILFLLLAFGSYQLYKKHERSSSLNGTSRDFKVENVEDIVKIFVVQRQGKSILLEKEGQKWMFNKEFEANPEVILNLLNTIKYIEVKNLIPKKGIKVVMEEIAKNGLKVEIYSKNGMIKSYYIGDGNQSETATHMVNLNSNIPYEVGIRNFDGNIRSRYWPISIDDLKSIQLINFNSNEIKSVSLDYIRTPNESFQIDIFGLNKYKLTDLKGNDALGKRKLKLGEVSTFLNNFIGINASSVLDKNMFEIDEHDFKVTKTPFLKLKITTQKDVTTSIVFYPILDDFEKQNLALNKDYHPSLLFVEKDSKYFFTTQVKQLKGILWSKSFFIQ